MRRTAPLATGFFEPREPGPGTYQVYEASRSAILTGDFNMRPDDPVKQAVSAPFANGAPALLDAWTVMRGRRRTRIPSASTIRRTDRPIAATSSSSLKTSRPGSGGWSTIRGRRPPTTSRFSSNSPREWDALLCREGRRTPATLRASNQKPTCALSAQTRAQSCVRTRGGSSMDMMSVAVMGAASLYAVAMILFMRLAP